MKVTVDGTEIELPNGTSAMDAVFAAGRDVPLFCAHEYLSPVGACRMCLVEAGSPRKGPDGQLVMEGDAPKIFFFPKPMASCTLQATDGMVIRTAATSEAVKKGQAGMMEFTLLNHPLDCPTCDKGGACELQDRAFEYGYGASRFGFDRRHADKHYPLSDSIILDQERCIHCKRCVRYFEEIPNQEVLDFIERGGHTFIDTEEGGLPTGFSGNIVDICPVGALLDNVARFRGRNWEYDHTATTCTLCPVGCSITVDARNGRLERIVARENREVNEAWICDAGRFGHAFASDDRLRTPMIRDGGQLRAATWDEAIHAIREGMDGLQPSDLALFTGADATLEEGVALEALAALTGTAHVDYGPRYPVSLDLPRPTLTEIAQSDAVIVVGADLGEEAPIVELRVLEMLKGGLLPPELPHGTAIADLRLVERPNRKRERLAVFHPTPTRLGTHAGITSHEPSLEVLEGLASLRGSTPIENAAKLLRNSERPILIVGADAMNQGGFILQTVLQNLASEFGAKVLPIPAASNSRGLGHLNLIPRGGGTGLNGIERLGAIFISRSNPGVRAKGLTIVHDTHLTETAKLADVVLPALTNYEKRGTVVNLEGRLLPLQQAAIESGEAADLIAALGAVAEALGLRARIRGLRSAQALLNDRFGLDFTAIPAEGLIVNLGPRHTGPTGRTHTPQLWKPGMRRLSGGSPEAQAELVGGDD